MNSWKGIFHSRSKAGWARAGRPLNLVSAARRIDRPPTDFPERRLDNFRFVTIRELIVTKAFIDTEDKLISYQEGEDSRYAVCCSSIAGMGRRP